MWNVLTKTKYEQTRCKWLLLLIFKTIYLISTFTLVSLSLLLLPLLLLLKGFCSWFWLFFFSHCISTSCVQFFAFRRVHTKCQCIMISDLDRTNRVITWLFDFKESINGLFSHFTIYFLSFSRFSLSLHHLHPLEAQTQCIPFSSNDYNKHERQERKVKG